jgi:hypothetical protein
VKALTIRQPWATLIADGVKTIETRSWSTRHRGPLAVHAGLTKIAGTDPGMADVYRPLLQPERAGMLRRPLALGAVVATAVLADCVPMLVLGDDGDHHAPHLCLDSDGEAMLLLDHGERDWENNAGDQLPFGDFAPGRWAWVLTDVQPFVTPIPAKGRQGLWDWDAA